MMRPNLLKFHEIEVDPIDRNQTNTILIVLTVYLDSLKYVWNFFLEIKIAS